MGRYLFTYFAAYTEFFIKRAHGDVKVKLMDGASGFTCQALPAKRGQDCCE
jgi:hypothetical protein